MRIYFSIKRFHFKGSLAAVVKTAVLGFIFCVIHTQGERILYLRA